jgi:DtxR family Mn-dependent transcriptional regulator
MSNLSTIKLDFLRELYLEAEANQRVTLRALGDRLGVTSPAVSRMAQRIVRRGLARRDGACGLALTETGLRHAMHAVRKQRVLEAYLMRELSYAWTDVYAPAAELANHLHDDVIERMFAQAGKPTHCPHGCPIPTRTGQIARVAAQRLTDLPIGASGFVARVSTHDADMLRYLDSLGIRPGAQVQFVSRAPFDGPLNLRIGAGSAPQDHAIGPSIAAHVWVA